MANNRKTKADLEREIDRLQAELVAAIDTTGQIVAAVNRWRLECPVVKNLETRCRCPGCTHLRWIVGAQAGAVRSA